MKKYLINGALALLAGGFMISCAEDSEYVPLAQQKSQAFEKIFTEVFGPVASDQTWGFSDEMILADADTVEAVVIESDDDAAARTRAAASTRAVEADWSQYARNFSNYLNPEAPNSWTTVKTINESDLANYTAFTDADITTAPFGRTLSDLYYYNVYDANGNYVTNTSSYVGNGDGKHYRVAAGTEIKEVFHINGTSGVINDAVIYIEGKVHMNGNTINGATIIVASTGELVIDGNQQFTNTARLLVKAGGKVTGANGVTLNITNGGPSFNSGTINFNGLLNINGCNFYNNGTVSVDTFTGTSDGTYVTNFGRITARTNSGAADAHNGIYVNACYMSFTQNAGIGQLTLLDNSRLDVGGTLYMTGNNRFYKLSMLNAGTIYWTNAKITGPTASGEFTIVKTEKMLISHANDLNVYNYVYIDMERDQFYNYQYVKEDLTNENGNAFHLLGGVKSNGEKWCDGPIKYWAEDADLYIPAGDCTGTGYPGSGTVTHEYGTGSTNIYTTVETDDWVQVTSQSGRVFCEDLGQATREDLDYNDAVFDVIIWKHTHTSQPMVSTRSWTTTDGVVDASSVTTSAPVTNGDPTVTDTYYAQIELLAAGGTLPLTVAGQEVHNAFGVGVTTMVNTYDANSTAFGSFQSKPSVAIGNETKSFVSAGKTYTQKLVKDIQYASQVPIYVNYSGTQVNELSANAGKAPHKILVPFGTKWSVERKNISLGYPDFASYVSDKNTNWFNNQNTYYLYDGSRGLTDMPKVMKTSQTSANSTEDVLWQGSIVYGSSWTLENVTKSFVIDKFWPGDHLRIYGANAGSEPWVTVTLPDGTVYIDSEFPTVDPYTGKAITAGSLDVLLDETQAAKLNALLSGGSLTLQIKGRNFTLTKITRVQF